MVEVTKEQFYKVIYDNDLDVCVHSDYNNIKKLMTTDFKFRNGVAFGVSYHNYDLDSDDYGKQTYHIVKEWIQKETA
jgi:hypothetical protein